MDLDIVSRIVEVCSTSGECFLGGDDFSALLAADITKATIETVEAKITAFLKIMQRINDKVEITKLALLTSEEITTNMPYITQDHAKCEATLTRVQFEEQISPHINKITSISGKVLESISNDDGDITKLTSLILVGGSTRISASRRFKNLLVNYKNNTVSEIIIIIYSPTIKLMQNTIILAIGFC